MQLLGFEFLSKIEVSFEISSKEKWGLRTSFKKSTSIGSIAFITMKSNNFEKKSITRRIVLWYNTRKFISMGRTNCGFLN